MATSDLQVHITRKHDQVTVTLVGEAHLDFDASDEYIRKVLGLQPKTVIVDAAGLTFISSVGMSFMLNLLRALQRAGGTLQLRSLQPRVRKVLEHAQVLQLFDVAGDDDKSTTGDKSAP
jgi:anti-anti-sigma factor